MIFRISNCKIICLIVVSLLLFVNAFPMDGAASCLGKRVVREEAQESDEQPAAKVQKTEHSVDVASHKLRKKIIEHFAEIGKGSFVLSDDLLIFIKKNPNLRDDRGNTLFHYALLFSNRDLLRMLMSNSKTDIAVRNDEGLSLLNLAVQQNDRLVVDYILYKAAERPGRISHEFMLDLYSVLSETAYVMSNPEIIQLLENFVMKNEAFQNDISLLAAAHITQLSTCHQGIRNKIIQQEQCHSQEKQLKKFLDAKKSIIEDNDDRLVKLFWNYWESDLNLNWQNLFTQNLFTLDEQNILCSAFSHGIVTILHRGFMQMYEDFRHENFFRFLIDIDTTINPELKERLKIIFALHSDDDMLPGDGMLPINLNQDDVEKLPIESFFFLVLKAISIKDKEFLKRNLKSKNAHFINKKDCQGNTLLHAAVNFGDLEIVEMILAWMPLLDVANDEGVTPLCIAVEFGNAEIVKAILACRSALNVNRDRDQRLLQVAIKKRHVEIVNAILASNPNISMTIERDSSKMLYEAVLSGRVEIVRAILNYTSKDADNIIPSLREAIQSGSLEIVQELFACKPRMREDVWFNLLGIVVERGKIPLIKAVLDYKQAGTAIEDNDARIALEILNNYRSANLAYKFLNAALIWGSQNSQEIVQIFLERDPGCIDAQDSFYMSTPLHMAIINGQVDLVKKLLEFKPNLNLQDCEGNTPLHVAAHYFSKTNEINEILDLLLSSGLPLDISIKNNNGKTAVDFLVARRDHLALCKMLNVNPQAVFGSREFCLGLLKSENLELIQKALESGFDVNTQDEDGDTLGHWAIYQNNIEKLKMVLDFKLNVNVQGRFRNTLLHAALSLHPHNDQWMQLILQYKPDVFLKNMVGLTALDMAFKSNNMIAASAILDYSPDLKVQDAHGNTLLHRACKNEEFNLECIVTGILKYNPSLLNVQNNVGETALDIAYRQRSYDRDGQLINVLRAAGAKRCFELIKEQHLSEVDQPQPQSQTQVQYASVQTEDRDVNMSLQPQEGLVALFKKAWNHLFKD